MHIGAPSDLDCKNKCIAGINPTNTIAQCQMNCPQGNGTATDNANYKACIQNCIDTDGGAAATATGAATGAATGTGAASGTATGKSLIGIFGAKAWQRMNADGL
jgi:hypothetical protein